MLRRMGSAVDLAETRSRGGLGVSSEGDAIALACYDGIGIVVVDFKKIMAGILVLMIEGVPHGN